MADTETNPWSVENASVFLKYCCPECNFKDGNLQSFANHALENHKRSNVLFTSEKTVKPEKLKKSSKTKQKYKCTELSVKGLCEASFGLKRLLKTHVEKKHKKIKFVCFHCDAVFSQKSVFEHHKSIHFGQKCNQCDLFFSDMQILKLHQVKVHELFNFLGLKPKPSVDPTPMNINTTMTVESDIINVGNKNFLNTPTKPTSPMLDMPSLDPDPYQCDECKKSFKTKQNLENHMNRIHKEIKDQKCDQCEYSCFSKSGLKSHNSAVHLKLRPFKCEENDCTETFSFKNVLKKHIKSVHKGIKDHHCSVCQDSFGEKQTLERHMKRFHLENTENAKELQSGHAVLEEIDESISNKEPENEPLDKKPKVENKEELNSSENDVTKLLIQQMKNNFGKNEKNENNR